MPLNYSRKVALLGITILVFASIVGPHPVRGDAPSPALAIGDQWKYSFQTIVAGLAMQGALTQTIAFEESVSVGGSTHDAFKATLSGSGSTSVEPGLSGTWTMSGSVHLRRSDLAEIRGSLTIVVYVGFTTTVIVETSNTPPVKHYDFPLSVNKIWTETNMVVTNATVTNSLGFRSSNVTTETTTHTYTVLRTERVTVTAGVFDTFVISRSSPGSTLEDYYSPGVGNSVKSITTNAGTSSNLSLVEYTYWPYKSPLDVSSGGRTFSLTVRSNVQASNLQYDSTTVTFDISGEAGLTGKAMISIPKGLNNTAIRVYVDSNLITSTTSQDPANYHVTFTFTLSTHTISVVYSAAARAPFLDLVTNPYVVGGIVGVAVIAVAALILVTRRRKPASVAPAPAGEQGPGPAVPPTEAPPAETPALAQEAPAPPPQA